MNNLSIDTDDLSGGAAEFLVETYQQLSEKFTVVPVDEFEFDPGKFDYLSKHQDATFAGAWLVNNCYVVILKIPFLDNAIRGRVGDVKYTCGLWLVIKQRTDFGRVLIRHETLADKILEAIHPVELKFDDDRTFSKKFYVVTNDKDKAAQGMTWNFRNALMDMPNNVVIEIVNNNLLICNNLGTEESQIADLIEFGSKVATVH